MLPTSAAEQIPNQWQGTIGEKITLSGTITRETTFEGYCPGHRPSRLIILTTSEGIVKMFTTAAWAYDVDRDDEVTVTGTVKAHDTYSGTRGPPPAGVVAPFTGDSWKSKSARALPSNRRSERGGGYFRRSAR